MEVSGDARNIFRSQRLAANHQPNLATAWSKCVYSGHHRIISTRCRFTGLPTPVTCPRLTAGMGKAVRQMVIRRVLGIGGFRFHDRR